MTKNNLIYKSNDIIEASYTLSVNEQRLLLACISMLRSNEELDITRGYTMTVEQSQDIFYTDKDKKNAYRDLKNASERLYDARIKLKSHDGRFEMLTRWVSTVKFDNKEMTATLYFHDQIKPYISQLHGNFTKYRVKWIAELKSKYSIRIYELIVSWYCQNKPYKEMEITEFRELLDMGEKYDRHNDFLRYVITPSITEINEHTDFELEISFKKRSRSFKWIQFRYNQKAVYAYNEEVRKGKRREKVQALEDKRQRAIAKEKNEEFLRFSKTVVIKSGMRFWCEKLGRELVVNENIAIMDKEAISMFSGKYDIRSPTYILMIDDIKRLIFAKEFKQVRDGLDLRNGELPL